MNPNSLSCTVAEFAAISADILRLGKSIRFQARGTSMHPLVRHGDRLLIQPVDPSKVRMGDVVLCRTHANGVVVHRVLGKCHSPAGYRLFIQGDQAAQPDGWLNQACIYGRLANLERNGKIIGMHQPVMRALGLFAALRSRWGLGRKGFSQVILKRLKSLPIILGLLQ